MTEAILGVSERSRRRDTRIVILAHVESPS